MSNIGILICNLGTPDAPTPRAIRRYLKEFLSDRRVINLPKFIWLPILYGLILPFRPWQKAKDYRKIWSTEGSPLLVNSLQQFQALQQHFEKNTDTSFALAMRYGSPSIGAALKQFQQAHISKLLIVPLYPQYSATTTASTLEKIIKLMSKWQTIPEIRMVRDYHAERDYIAALANSIKQSWQQTGRTDLLFFSFHGLPQKYIDQGDVYYQQCLNTAKLVAEQLQLAEKDWVVAFQSRLGKTRWLQPYADKVLVELPKQGIRRITAICPGFSADCLETLEEMQIQYQKLFLQAGGEQFTYVPALNANPEHIIFLANLIQRHLQGWDDTPE